MLAKIIGVCAALLIVFVVIPSFAIGLVIYGGILFTTYSLNQAEMNAAKLTSASAVMLRTVMIFMVMVQTRSVNGKI